MTGAAMLIAVAICIFRDAALGHFHVVVASKAYRSALPQKARLERWVARYGIRTIINLRGASPNDPYREERIYPAGMARVNIPFAVTKMPSALHMRELVEAIEESPGPILLHCHSGIDRTGMASVIAAMALGGKDYDSAKKHLSWRYGHLRTRSRKIVGLFDTYEQWCKRNGMSTGGWRRFRQWVMNVYHPYYYKVEIICPSEVVVLPDGYVDVEVVVVNRSDMVLPAARGEFRLAAFTGSSRKDLPEREVMPRILLQKKDIAPGESVILRCSFRPPVELIGREIHFDLVEERVTWFARQGSEVASLRLMRG